MTYHDIKHNAEVNELLKKGNQNLGLLALPTIRRRTASMWRKPLRTS